MTPPLSPPLCGSGGSYLRVNRRSRGVGRAKYSRTGQRLVGVSHLTGTFVFITNFILRVETIVLMVTGTFYLSHVMFTWFCFAY